MRKQIIVGLLSAGIIATGGAGTAAYASTHKDVTLALDGSDREVSTFSGTVGELLQSQHIDVGEHDVVAPGVSDPLDDGERVVVRFGRELRVTVDGKPTSYWTTASSVSDALDQTGLRFEGAALSASRSAGIGRAGLDLSVHTAKKVTVVAAGKKRSITTTGLTVSDALSAAKVKVDSDDKVNHKLTTRITNGSSVTVVKVDKKTKKVATSIGYKTIRKADSSMYKGKSKTERDGRRGKLVSTLKVVYLDGEASSKKTVSTKVVKHAVDAIVRYGTKPVPSNNRGGGSGGSGGGSGGGGGGGGPVGGGVDSLNWAALAQCESGGNPHIVSAGGSFYGLYQFTISTWHSVGGSGTPIDNSAGEQTYRAKILYKSQGASPWPVCGRNLFR